MEKEPQNFEKRAAGIPLKRKFGVRISEILVEITTVILPAQLATVVIDDAAMKAMQTHSRPATGYLQSFCCTLLQKKASSVQTFLSPTSPFF